MIVTIIVIIILRIFTVPIPIPITTIIIITIMIIIVIIIIIIIIIIISITIVDHHHHHHDHDADHDCDHSRKSAGGERKDAGTRQTLRSNCLTAVPRDSSRQAGALPPHLPLEPAAEDITSRQASTASETTTDAGRQNSSRKQTHSTLS
jgi:hypothetical protein